MDSDEHKAYVRMCKKMKKSQRWTDEEKKKYIKNKFLDMTERGYAETTAARRIQKMFRSAYHFKKSKMPKCISLNFGRSYAKTLIFAGPLARRKYIGQRFLKSLRGYGWGAAIRQKMAMALKCEVHELPAKIAQFKFDVPHSGILGVIVILGTVHI